MSTSAGGSNTIVKRQAAEPERLKYDPHEGQKEVHKSHARWKVLEVARRWGKGRCGFGELMYTYQEVLGMNRDESLVPSFHAWIVVPSYSQGVQVWGELMSFIPRIWIDRVNQTEKIIYLKGSPKWKGGYGLIELKSADNPDALQTTGLDFLWISEAQDIRDTAYLKLVPATISPGVLGRVFIEGIPALYPDHWFRRVYNEAWLSNNAQGKGSNWKGKRRWFAYKATYLDNPLLSEEQIEEILEHKKIMPESAWRRMYLAEFNQSAGYFHNIDSCIAGDEIAAPIPGDSYVAGLDLGRRRDFTVLTMFNSRTRQVVHVRVLDPSLSWVDQRMIITSMYEEWNFHNIVVDSTGVGDVMAEELEHAGLPVEFFTITGENRIPLLEGLAVALERETVHFPPNELLIRQLRAFQHRKVGNNRFRAEAPPGEYDDAVFSLALGLVACDEPHVVAPHGRLRSRRYAPTHEEMMAGGVSQTSGQKRMVERKEQRRRERYERLGVHIGDVHA